MYMYVCMYEEYVLYVWRINAFNYCMYDVGTTCMYVCRVGLLRQIVFYTVRVDKGIQLAGLLDIPLRILGP